MVLVAPAAEERWSSSARRPAPSARRRVPGLAVFETCRRIKAEPSLSHIPSFLTAFLDTLSSSWRAYAAGGVDICRQPAACVVK